MHGEVRGRPVGGGLHAVVAVAYDDKLKAIRMRDSRGVDFGDDGHWWMPYDVIRQPWLVTEAWTVTAITF